MVFANLSNETLNKHLKQLDRTRNSFYTLMSDDSKTVGLTLGVKELKTSELEVLLKDINQKFVTIFNIAMKFTSNLKSIEFTEKEQEILIIKNSPTLAYIILQNHSSI